MTSSWARVTLIGFLILVGLAFAPNSQAQVVINEIHYNPVGTDSVVLLEFVELHNAGGAAVSLAGWELDFGPQPFVFPGGATIGAGEYVVVAENIVNLQAATGYAALYEFGGLDAGLGNGSDDIELRDGPEGTSTVIDRVDYDDDPPWPTGPDSNGPSLELIHPLLDNALPNAWRASLGANGTPGAQNSVYSTGPIVELEDPRRLSAVADMPAVSVTFSSAVTGVTAADLTVGGSAATAVTGSGVGPYLFSGYSAPAAGSVTVSLASGTIMAGGEAFAGDSWTVSVGLVLVINELHYHPADPYADAEFIEIYNAGTTTADMSNWTISDGLDMAFPPTTTLAPDSYLVIALDPVMLQAVTGYVGALPWDGGRLSNGGERLSLADADGNELDVVSFSDSGNWVSEPDGTGPSLELINSGFPNEFGQAWAASTIVDGTPGAQNSQYLSSPPPIIVDVIHDPPIPGAGEAVTVTAHVIDLAMPTVLLFHRQDQEPTVAYATLVMTPIGNDRYSMTVPGLAEGQRMDFAVVANNGTSSVAPAGHDGNFAAGGHPPQTFLCKFTDAAIPTDYPSYHLITTQYTRNLQTTRNKTEYDATFLRCDAGGVCEIFYNIRERYRGASSLNQNPPSFRFEFSSDQPLESEMGFDIRSLNLMGQQPARQGLGYGMFEDTGHASPRNQFVHLNSNPLVDDGTQEFLYINVERIDEDFFDSQNGDLTPLRYPDRCDVSDTVCETDFDCPGGEFCVPTDTGSCYRGRHDTNARLIYLGQDPDAYRVNSSERNGYQQITNEEEDDWTDLINLTDALWCSTSDGGLLCVEDTYDNWYPTNLPSYAVVQQWAEWFAMHMTLNNTEGGIYRDTGDDYFLYFWPTKDHAVFLPWDMDAILPANNETIWRTNVTSVQRFLRHNEFAGLFVGAICDNMNGIFSEASMDARIDALPDPSFPTGNPQGNGPQTKQGMKDWVDSRRAYITNEISWSTTLTGVPASPYTDPNPVIALSGALNQCGAHRVVINGQTADSYAIANPGGSGANWSSNFTLVPGSNNIVVQTLDHLGVVIDSAQDTVFYAPPGTGEPDSLYVNMPTRMVNTKTLTLKAQILDAIGEIHWETWTEVGIVSARRVSDGTPVPTSVTVFETRNAGTGAGGPGPDEIRFYNGVGNVSITIDDPASVVGEAIEVEVNVLGLTGSRVVSIIDETDAGSFTTVSGTLSGATTWGPSDGVIHMTDDVTIGSGSTLTIEPGTLIMVDAGPNNDGTGIFLNGDGNILANGTEAEPIMFFPTSGAAGLVLPQTQQNNYSSWRGVVHEGAGSSVYSYVFLVGAGNGPTGSHPRSGVLRIDDTHSVEMYDCVMADSPGKGLFVLGNNDVTLLRNSWSRIGYGGECLGGGHNLLIEDSWFTRIGYGPEAVDLDGDIFHLDNGSATQTIRRSVLADCGDDMIDHSGANPVVENTLIWDADDKCVSLSGGGSVTFNNVLVFGMPLGVNGAGGILTHVTINVSGTPMGAPISVDNSIIWPQGMNTGACNGNINYTLAGSTAHLACGTDNLNTNPLFQDPGNYDYSLQAGSPAASASPTGGRIGWLGFPDGAVCVVDGDCDDSNACTADTCDAGACVFNPIPGCTPCLTDPECDDGDPCTVDTCSAGICASTAGNDGAVCDDGWICTIDDECASGLCAGTESCPPGQHCDGAGFCTADPLTLTFQDGGTYAGTHDTFLQEATPDAVNGALETWEWDLEDPAPNQNIGLLRFDDFVGLAAGQIPQGTPISSATLTLVIFDESVAPAGAIHLGAVAWDEVDATWNNFGGEAGVQLDEYGAFVADAPMPVGTHVIDVTSAAQGWINDPATNFGLVFLPAATNGAQVRSSEYAATPAERPILSIDYLPAGCTSHAQCDDGLYCNGVEACDIGGTDLCVAGAPVVCDDTVACTVDSCDEATDSCDFTPDDLSCDDGNVCTDNYCDAALDCQSTDNTVACDDGDACTENDTCAAGVCTTGTAVDCDDSVACTDDSCDSGLGCQNVDNCTDPEACNLGTGICEIPVGPQAGDVIISGFSPHPEPEWIELFNTTASPVALDGMTLVTRLDIGTGDGTVEVEWTLAADPTGLTIPAHGFFLVGEAAIAPAADLVDVMDLATGEGGSAERAISIELVIDGVHMDYVLYGRHDGSSPAGELPPGDIAFDGSSWPRSEVVRTVTGTLPIASYAEGPSQRLSADDLYAGYAVDGYYTDEAALPDSFPVGVWTSLHSNAAPGTPRNSASPTVLPPNQPCTLDAECDDGLYCNGAETCDIGGTDVCLAGTPIVCDDTIACTVDSCNETTDSCDFTPDDLSCDDGNVCTDNYCDAALDCQSADNTAACEDGDACTENDICAAGACTAGSAVTCDDSVACTDDSCDSGLGCQFVDNCTGGETCNLGTGICETGPAVPPLPIVIGDSWKYFKGTVEPPVAWNTAAFDDSSWTDGGTGMGYDWYVETGGTNGNGDYGPFIATEIDDMSECTTRPPCVNVGEGYVSVYLRYAFWVDSPAQVDSLTFDMYADDGYVAYINGVEVARQRVVGTPPAYNTNATGGPTVAPPIEETLDLTGNIGDLVVGVNVLAVQVHNANLTSRDLLVIPQLSSTSSAVCTLDAECDDGLYCNGAETCDVGSGQCLPGTAVDCDDGIACTVDSCNETTDSCEHSTCAMTVSAVGSRYLAVTPPGGLASVALRVDGGGLSCLPRYVDANGELGDSPVFQASVDWGTVFVADQEILPGTTYDVQAEITPGVPIGSDSATTWSWGQTNNIDDVNMFDVLCVMDGFGGVFTHCTLQAEDLMGFVPNRVIDVDDILAVLDAFQSLPYPDTTPCAAPVPPPLAVDNDSLGAASGNGATPDRFAAIGGGGASSAGDDYITLIPTQSAFQAGDTFEVDVYLSSALDLRAYQVAVDLTGGVQGSLQLESVRIDDYRGNYLFRDLENFRAVDRNGRRLAGALAEGGATELGSTYLGTLTLHLSEDAQGLFNVSLRPEETLLRNSLNENVEVDVYSMAVAVGISADSGDEDDSGIGTRDAVTAAGEVIISGFQPSGTPEWIELFNTTANTIDLDTLELIVRFDADSNGVSEVDWQLPAGLLAGRTIAPHSFFLLGETGTSPAADLTTTLDFATGEGGERGISIDLVINSIHQDYLLYGLDTAEPGGTADVPPGDLPFDGVTFPRSEVIRTCSPVNAGVCTPGASYVDGIAQRVTADDLYAGHDVAGYYSDEGSLSDGYSVGVWTSPHATTGGPAPRNSSSGTVDPPVVCTGDLDCDDLNPCTDDSCNLGTGECEYSNNTATCDDGVACTDDICSAGACVGTDNCTGGDVCNLGSGVCEAPPAAPPLPIQLGDEWRYRVNTDEPDAAWRNIGFEDSGWLAGPGGLCYGTDCASECNTAIAGMSGITPTTYYRYEFHVDNPATIQTLTLTVTYDDAFIAYVNGVEAARSNVWGSCDVTTATACLTDGDCPGGESCLPPAYDRLAGNPPGNGPDNHECNTGGPAGLGGDEDFDISAVIPDLVSGTNVIALQGHNLGLTSSDFVQSAKVTAVTVAGCTGDPDCDDTNPCTDDSCNLGTGLCEYANNVAVCDDGDPCTEVDTCGGGTCAGSAKDCGLQYCEPASGVCVDCVLDAHCVDADLCNGDETCSANTCAAGSALVCDDTVACTDDSCDAAVGCQFVDNCTGGETCNLGTGICEVGPVVTSFQDGDANGYDGTHDTYLRQAAADTVSGATADWGWDAEDPAPNQNIGLVRFDAITGAGAGQIPVGATVYSATLTLVVFNPSLSPAGDIYLAAIDWDQATATWNNFGGDAGVQPDEYGAFAAVAPITAATQVIDVTSAVQSWVSNPATNHGLVFLPNSVDGADVRSSEYATVAERPLLTVEYELINCTTHAECDDGLYCNGAEVCDIGGLDVCLPGTPPVCDDLVACTVDSCNETTDSCDVTPDDLFCDDGNVCTDNTCDTVSGCQTANNTVTCEDGDACTENDVCAAGACTSGTALSCDDGVSCTDDSCDSGSGCLNVDNCTGGEVCNVGTDTCEVAPPAQLLPIVQGDSWHYFKGRSEPTAGWNDTGFDDSTWAFGGSGIGYDFYAETSGTNANGDYEPFIATQLDDMSECTTRPPCVNPGEGYYSVYLRKEFTVPNPAELLTLTFQTYSDDAFVAYLNGTEVARYGVTGTPPAFDTTADAGPLAGETPPVNHTVDLTSSIPLLVTGTNVLAIQGHNAGLTSRDFLLIPQLSATYDLTAPDQPVLVAPADGAIGASASPELRVNVTDPDADTMDVTFYGRLNGSAPPPEMFTLIHMTDLQFLAQSYPATYLAMTQWIRDNRDNLNIVFSTLSGDIVNVASDTQQWINADAALDILDPAYSPEYPDGVPYGVLPGNHDVGDGLVNYNTYFGVDRFIDKGWYGGWYDDADSDGQYDVGETNNNHYDLFSGGGMDFIAIHLEWDVQNDPNVLTWVDDLLTTYSDRRAIIASHYLMETGEDGPLSVTGQAVLDTVVGHPNVFMMLCGHRHGEGKRVDVGTLGNDIVTLIADYQDYPNGGDGNLRILQFSPADDEISVFTYSPVLDAYITDSDSEFVLPYDMEGGIPFVEIGTVTGVASGTDAFIDWPGLDVGAEYEWYVTVTDGTSTTTGPTWTFTTACDDSAQCDDGNPCTDDTCNVGTGVCEYSDNTAACEDGDLCTLSDVCAAGSCTPGTPVVCGGGQTCNPGTGLCEADPLVVTFQQGVGGYTGTVDTFLNEALPTADNSAATTLIVDLADGGTPRLEQVLMRFDNVFTSDGGPVPDGATIESATLTINVTNESANSGASLHRMLQPWLDTDNYNDWGLGIQADDVEAVSTADVSSASAVGLHSIDVTNSVAAWSAGQPNDGWVWLPPATDNSWQFNSAEGGTPPELSVTYAICLNDVECDDGNVCTIDSCAGGACLNVDDDGATCDDGDLCTLTDSCSGGTCAGTPVSCPGGHSCNPTNGICEPTPIVATFQEGLGGYAGTQDTYIQTATPDNVNGALETIEWDDDDPAGDPVEPNYGLIRFDNIVGPGPGQVPEGSVIVSATLTYTVFNDGLPGSLHQTLLDWDESSSMTSFCGATCDVGVEYELDSPDVAVAPALGTYSADVAHSLEHWVLDPSSNRGWIIVPQTLPSSGGGVNIRSSEYAAAVAERPILVVEYFEAVCTVDADCNDNNVCTGIEICNTGTGLCIPGTPLDCSDGNFCTDDTCDPVTGCANVNNTAPCDDGDACTENDACSGGACQPGTAADCNDGVACTADTCDTGLGCQNVDNCPVNEVCNYGTGVCDSAPVADPLPIDVGDTWTYFRGTVEPTGLPDLRAWTDIGFDDLGWEGPSASGFGYGADCSTLHGTVLGDMQSSYVSVYARRLFHVDNASLVNSLELIVDYDDGWVAYLNGSEVARSAGMGGTPGTPPTYDQTTTTTDHECSLAATGNPADVIDLSGSTGLLVTGTNVLAIQGHNRSLTSSDFSLIPSMTATFDTPCTGDGDCDDGNVCTDDTCNLGSGECEYADNAAVCDDGVACTDDVCAGGVCVGSDNCTGGEICNHTSGVCETPPTLNPGDVIIAGFQSANNVQTTNLSEFISLFNTTDTAISLEGLDLLVYLDVNGDGFLQVDWQLTNALPDLTGATIQPYSFFLVAESGVLSPGGNFHDLEVALDMATGELGATERSAAIELVVDGVTLDHVVYGRHDGVTPAGELPPGDIFFDGVSWPRDEVLRNTSGGASFIEGVCQRLADTDLHAGYDVVGFYADEDLLGDGNANGVWTSPHNITFAAYEARNSLSPQVLPPTQQPCTLDSDCDDSDVCNGDETCPAGFCEAGTPLDCNDGNVCTDDACDALLGCINLDNTDTCDDGDACTSGDVCGGGFCAGSAVVCDDGVACTDDACDSVLGCQNVDNCPGGQNCNLSTGICETGPAIATFQNDGTYTGTHDAFLMESQPTATHGTLSDTCPGTASGPCDNFEWDADDPSTSGQQNIGLIRFDGIVGGGAGQVPQGATVSSATLTITLYDPSAAPPADIYVSLVDWDQATATWDNFGGESGVQPDEQGPVVGVAPISNGTYAVDITTAAQDWVNDPANNFGLIVMPNAADGAVVRSSEYATVGLRPLLTIEYEESGAGLMTCALSSGLATPDSNVGLEIFLEDQGGMPGLRGYQTQIVITRTSGTGTVSVGCPGGVVVDDGRADYVFFNEAEDYPVTNCGLQRAASTLLTGAVTVGAGQHYLSSYTLDVSTDATEGSTFEVSFAAFPDSSLADIYGDPITAEFGPVCQLTIQGCGSDAQCDDGNPCTDDSCDAGSCVNTNDDSNVCDDGDACTENDACSAGVCGGTVISCDDGNVCTMDTCNAGVCEYAASGICGVSGTVNYYRDFLASTEPSTKPVSGVGIDINSDTVADDTSDVSGAYVLGSLFGPATVTTLDNFGSPRAADHNDAISSFDATFIAQHVVEQVVLSSNQQIAADVTGNGEVTSFDASFVARFAAELIDHFDVATANGSDWQYFRCDNYVDADNQDCVSPVYTHNPLTGAEIDDFYALLYGDVTGNWADAGKAASVEAAVAAEDRKTADWLRSQGIEQVPRYERTGPATVSWRGWDGPLAAGEQRQLVLHLADADGIAALDLELLHDSGALRIVDVVVGDLSSDFNLMFNEIGDRTKVGMYGLLPLEGSGAVLTVTVEALRDVGRQLPIRVAGSANEGEIMLTGLERSRPQNGPVRLTPRQTRD